MATDKSANIDSNRDPITGAPGAHPVGTGLGAAAGGAAAGAAVGTVAGPAGTAVGAAVGAIAGGLVGKGVAEAIDPTAEAAHWEANYTSRPYVAAGTDYAVYAPAYRYGWESRARFAERSWDEVSSELAADWPALVVKSGLSWDRAEPAVRDAWHRPDRTPLA